MGLRSDIQEALVEAFDNDLIDVVVAFNLVKSFSGVYNIATDTHTTNKISYPTRGIFSSFGAKEIDGVNIRSEDEKVLINGSELSIDPVLEDVVLLTDGTESIVIGAKKVLGGGTNAIIHVLQIRKNSK